MPVTLTYHGHSALSLNVDGTRLVVDPFFDDNPLARTRAASVRADFILLTHGHGDHVGDTLSIARRTGATVIANFEIATWVNEKGHASTHPQHIGGAWTHPFGRVKMTPALHGSMLPDGANGGMPGGFLLEVANKRIYVAGDTALSSDKELIGRGGLDLAVLPIGDNFTMGPEDALLALDYLKPKAVIPCHYNTWPLIAVDVPAWAERVSRETDVHPVVLDVDGQYTV